MSETSSNQPVWYWLKSFSVLGLFAILFVGTAAAQTTFPGTGTGAIPDKPSGPTACGLPVGAPLNVTFNVTGMPAGAPSNVRLNMTAAHTWVGDLDVTLTAPNGTSHVIFGSTGSIAPGGCGDSSAIGATYSFADSGAAGWWALPDPFPAGIYRTTVMGDQASPPAGNPTNMNAAFAGIPTMNGTWTLKVTDGGTGDIGNVSAAGLVLTGAAAPTARRVDHDGDGKTDHMVARATNNPLSENAVESPFNRAGSYRERLKLNRDNPIENLGANDIYWYTSQSSNGNSAVEKHGLASTDFITPADFDGDLKSDIAVWRSGPPATAAFYILKTTDITVQTEVFGQANDNPAVVGDYDGDGKADAAVMRCPSTAGQCFYYYRGSNANPSGNITYQPWGNGTFFSVFPNTGDFDGDGKHDFCIQRTNPAAPGQGQFVLLRSSDNGVEYIDWGLNTDLIFPGDYDGDGKSDFTVGRLSTGLRIWYTRFRTGGNQQIQWGVTNDFPTPGDYDGDGKTDISVWRPSNGFFYTLKSSDSMLQSFKWGTSGDYPPANSQVQ